MLTWLGCIDGIHVTRYSSKIPRFPKKKKTSCLPSCLEAVWSPKWKQKGSKESKVPWLGVKCRSFFFPRICFFGSSVYRQIQGVFLVFLGVSPHRDLVVSLSTSRTWMSMTGWLDHLDYDFPYTLWLCQNSYWKLPIEIVNFPSYKMVVFHSCVSLPEGIGNVIIPTDFNSIIFQRGRSTTNQMSMYQFSKKNREQSTPPLLGPNPMFALICVLSLRIFGVSPIFYHPVACFRMVA